MSAFHPNRTIALSALSPTTCRPNLARSPRVLFSRGSSEAYGRGCASGRVRNLLAQAQQQLEACSTELGFWDAKLCSGVAIACAINGVTVGAFSGEAGVYQGLEARMQPGVNRVRLSFSAPGEPGPFGTEAELRCLAPGVASSRDTILRLQPTAKRLSAETEVNYVPR